MEIKLKNKKNIILDRLAAAGSGIRDEFYKGEVGRLLVQDLQKLGL